MNKSCVKGRHKSGSYIVSAHAEEVGKVIDWIDRNEFREFEKSRHELASDGRPRNKIYTVKLSFSEHEMVMKVSHINPRYRLSRKIDLFLSSLIKNYGKISFEGALALYNCGLPVACPQAFWTSRQSFFKRKSYFLCTRLPGQQSLEQWCRSCAADNHRRILAAKAAAVVRNIHAHQLRHGDLHAGNFYVHFPSQNRKQKPSDAKLFLLDYDNCSKPGIKMPWIKSILDLRDLSRLHIPGVDDRELLTMYLGKQPTAMQLWFFKYWRQGGFNVRRWIGLPPKKAGRHYA